ncbi:TetR-like C-terminal domain-containing protein [Micromonospora sp. 050-3]|uniref:TetR-like C-terminal domain-containing protein n=1 Tax=Micromonospora sp. 050-3 TaxID=2789265 RepID=UPI003977F3A2
MLEALLERVEPHGTYPDTGDLSADFKTRLQSITTVVASTVVGDTLRALLADAQNDLEVAKSFRDAFYSRGAAWPARCCGEPSNVVNWTGSVASGASMIGSSLPSGLLGR